MRVTSLSLGLAIGIALTASAPAAPLDPLACDAARTEKTDLDSNGVGADVRRGPDWGKSNLDDAALKKVARWIELEEQLLFRCPVPKPPPAPPGGAATAATGATDATTSPDAGEPKQVKPSKKSKKDAQKKRKRENAEQGGLDQAGATVAVDEAAEPPKAKKSKKAKAEDAYSPPKPGDIGEVQHSVPGGEPPDSGGSDGALPAGSQGLSP